MSSPLHRTRYTWAEYLALEASSNVKHEYLNGQIYAMAGGTPEHAALAAAVIGLLFPQLRGAPCRAHDADLRVRVPKTGLATYPDVTIVCGPSQFEHYKGLSSLSEYVLVSHRERKVEVWVRDPEETWTCNTAQSGEVARLASIGARLDVDELYEAATEPAG
jgi:Uma2 family endonuclease